MALNPSPSVTGLTVRPLGKRRDGLLEVVIDAPVNGGASEAWAVRVRGHVLGAVGPVQAVDVVVPGRILATAPVSLPTPVVAAAHPDAAWAASCGFTLLIDTLGLPRQFEVRLRATLADGSRVKIAEISGERVPLATAYAPRLLPLLVTSLGRMGTTLLMRMLAAHPGVVAYARAPYEVRAGKYWLHVLKVLTAPTDAGKRVGAPMEFHLETSAAGGNPFYSAAFAAWPGVEAWSGSKYATEAAAFCQRSIDGWYLATAAAQDQEEASLVYFAEKHFPDDYPRLMRELYPGARELFLVRDFRDMIASMLAYNARRGFDDFGREKAANDAAWLEELRRGVAALRDAWRERGEPGSLVRYEDLVREPEATVRQLLAGIGLDHSPEIVARVVAGAANAPELQAHGTTESPAASIGRWQRDLPEELRRPVEEAFAGLLAEFGYDAYLGAADHPMGVQSSTRTPLQSRT